MVEVVNTKTGEHRVVVKVVNGECDEKLAIEALAKKIEVVNLKTDELKTWLIRHDITLPSQQAKRPRRKL